MSTCKYCQAEITWSKQGERNIPINKDGTTHNCKKPAPEQPQKHIGFKEAEEAMVKKEQQQVKPAETCTSPTVPDAEEEVPTGEVISVTIGSTISLGNYSNVHLEIVATDAETARVNFRKEIAETVKMVRGILKDVGGS